MEEINVKALIPSKERKEIEKAIEFCGSLESLVINTEEEYTNAVSLIKDVKSSLKLLKAFQTDITKPMNDRKGAVIKEFKTAIDPLSGAEEVIKAAMGVYAEKTQLKQQEQARMNQADATNKQDKLFQRAEKELHKAEEYRAQGKHGLAEKADARAMNFEEQGASTTAEAVEDTTKVKGVSYRDVFEIIIKDQKKAINALLENPFLEEFVKIDEAGLKKLLNQQKKAIKIDGIFIEKKKKPIVRT